MHLNADELVDIAEGTRPESAAPHLAGCAQCRAQLADLRATMSAVAEVEVPEPSPLFWDHFSQRVHDAVAAEGDARPTARAAFVERVLAARAFQASVVAIASLVIVVFVASRTNAPRPAIDAVGSQAALRTDLFSDSPVENDASLSLVAMLAASVDADAAGDAALTSVGSAEHAVTHLNDAELRELRRILREELTP